jgi:Family of unknown function (DUF6069)
MSNTPTPTAPTTTTVDRRAIWRAGGIAAAGAALANVAVALIASAADVSLEVKQMGADVREELPIVLFAVASVVGALIGVGLAQLLATRAGARQRFVQIGIIGTVLSFVSPLAADADSGTKAVLTITHVVAAAVILPLLAKTLRR